MTTNVEQATSAGIDSVYWAVNNATGYAMGITGSIANGGDAGMGRLLGVQTLNPQVQAPDQVDIEGDDQLQASFFFSPQTGPNGDLVLGVFDANLIAKAQGTNVYADGDHDLSVLQPEDFDFAELSFVVNSQAKSRASGSSGEAGFIFKHYPKAQLVPLGDTGQQSRTATSWTHRIVLNQSSVWAWGAALSTANEGTARAAILAPVWSENRVHVHTFVGDGSTTNFTLDQTPAAANGNKIKAWKDGTALAYTTNFTASSTTITFEVGSVPAAGEIVVFRYEYT